MDVVRTDAGSVGGPQTRPPLSRDLIISRAIDMADTAGVASISMRKLGQELGVEAMSLYHYVNGREDLLEGIVDRLVGQIPTQPDGALHPSDSWQAFLQWFAHSVRDVATQHPLLFPLIATRHPAATWLRPPLRSIRLVEGFFEAVTERGLTDRQAVMVYRSFTCCSRRSTSGRRPRRWISPWTRATRRRPPGTPVWT